jgi:hypothetical protein
MGEIVVMDSLQVLILSLLDISDIVSFVCSR